ncbi:hypothetical protein JKP88DRAFT_254509 [Tribonema minus]|uniref:Uncharacterized protein n=1 Tax=Tribonema minus TaxID=303371 RepID=A0A835Z6H8_9STRA|nr:hypothetical protein JKP88DRAFT_254509 [Tribonema minus]
MYCGLEMEYSAVQASWGVECALRFKNKGKMVVRQQVLAHPSNVVMTPKTDAVLVPCFTATSIHKAPGRDVETFVNAQADIGGELPLAHDRSGRDDEVWLSLPAELEASAVRAKALVHFRGEVRVVVRAARDDKMRGALTRYLRSAQPPP